MLYKFLRKSIQITMWFFHNQWKVIGKKNIPKDMPVIFAPNHQNGLHDAFVLTCSQKQSLNSWSRADIFTKPLMASFFGKVGMMPTYRIRDGINQLSKNNAIIAEAKRRMEEDNEAFLIFPEASHDKNYRMRAVTKGLARLAFSINHPKGVAVIPSSLHYDNHTASRQGLLVTFQTPIYTKDFESLFQENPQRAYRAFNKAIVDNIKKGLWHINRMDLHDEIVNAIKSFWFIKGIKKTENRLNIAQELTGKLENAFNTNEKIETDFKRASQVLLEISKQLDLPHNVQKLSLIQLVTQAVLYLILMPVFLLSFLNGSLFVCLPSFVTNFVFYDKHYSSSGKIGFSFIAGLLLFPLQVFILNLFFNWNFVENIAYIAITIACSYFAFYYKKNGLSYFRNMRFSFLLKIKDEIALKFQSSRTELLNMLEKL